MNIKSVFLLLIASSVAQANHCPPPSEIFQKQGGKYITLTPPGWRWSSESTNEITSSDVRFVYAHWCEHSIAADERNRVLCIYENFHPHHYIGPLTTQEIVQKERLANHANWEAIAINWFSCFTGDVFQCLFD